MKLDLTGKVIDGLDGRPLADDQAPGESLTMARALARILADAHQEDPAKCLEIARRLYATESIDLDLTDAQMVERVVRSHRRVYLGIVTGALALEIMRAKG